MSFEKSKLTRIGVFYDGNYFFHVSNYYQYQHVRKARISIDGLHEFIRHQVSEAEGEDVKYCQIVDAHYFRGRPRAQEAEARGLLLRERQFDDARHEEERDEEERESEHEERPWLQPRAGFITQPLHILRQRIVERKHWK